MLIIATMWTATVGGFLYFLATSQSVSLETNLSSALQVAALLAAFAAVGSGVYAYYWSGRYGPYIDYVAAIFTSLIAVFAILLVLLVIIIREVFKAAWHH